jgi:hypothetical protein
VCGNNVFTLFTVDCVFNTGWIIQFPVVSRFVFTTNELNFIYSHQPKKSLLLNGESGSEGRTLFRYLRYSEQLKTI